MPLVLCTTSREFESEFSKHFLRHVDRCNQFSKVLNRRNQQVLDQLSEQLLPPSTLKVMVASGVSKLTLNSPPRYLEVIVIEPSAMPQEAPQHLCADAGYTTNRHNKTLRCRL